MPVFTVNCTLPAGSIPDSFAQNLGDILGPLLGMPKERLVIWVVPDQRIVFSMEPGPAALCELFSVEGISADQNEKYSEVICSQIEKDLGISPERMLIHFHKVSGTHVGYNKKTLSYLDKE